MPRRIAYKRTVILRLLSFVGVGLLSGCVTAPPSEALSPIEFEAICEMTADIEWQPFGTVSWEEDPKRMAALNAISSDDEFETLPARVRCPRGRVTLHRSNGIPFDKFWISSDARQAAISGGWFGGELLGGGGVCYFSKAESKWVRQGCLSTWAV